MAFRKTALIISVGLSAVALGILWACYYSPRSGQPPSIKADNTQVIVSSDGSAVIISNKNAKLPKPPIDFNQLTEDLAKGIGPNSEISKRFDPRIMGGHPHPPAEQASHQDIGPALNAPPSNVDRENECRSRNLALGIVATNPTAPCVEIGDVVQNLKRGTYQFNKPSSATLDEAFTLRLVLLTSRDQATNFRGLPGAVEVRPDRPFAQSIDATLSSDDFEISPIGPQSRTATLSHPVEWEWKVRPTSGGTKSLTIDVAANILVGSEKSRVQINTLHESIEIQVTVLQRIKAFVASASGAMTAAAAAATSLAGLVGFFPKVRQFFRDYVLSFFRRPRRRRRGPA